MKRSTLILVINISVLVLIVLLGLAAQVAPYFTCSILAVCVVTFLFILTEQWSTHDAVEFENRFWTMMAFILATVCLFCKDSPLRFPEDRPGLAWLIVFVFSFLAHNYDRHLHRLVLSKTPNIRRVKSAEFGAENRNGAQQKVLEIRKLLTTIDHTWMSSTFLNLFFLPRVLYVERQIIHVLSEANADELNLIISNIELALLFYKVKDHKIARRFNRTNLLTLLAVDRISELGVPARVVLLDGLQRMKLSAHPQCEQYVRNILTTTKTDDLSELKSLTDCKGDVNSMHKLIYKDLRNLKIRDSILSYIAQQAKIQAAHFMIGSRKSKQRGKLAWRKILSDVDDTVTCSGGSWPAGMDTSYPKKAVYPGVLAFYRELDLGTSGPDEWDSASQVGNLVFLSARPHVYKSVSENVTYSKFRAMQKERGLYTSPSLLAGSLDTGGQFMVKGDTEPLALKKFENFQEYLTLYPEFTCIFIGDNGQGDVRTAEMVLDHPQLCHNLHRVYVHQIQPRHRTYCASPATMHPERAGPASTRTRICYFRTYIEAALDAHAHKLLRDAGLRKIMEEACADFLFIPAADWAPAKASSTHASAAAAAKSSTGVGRPTRGAVVTSRGSSPSGSPGSASSTRKQMASSPGGSSSSSPDSSVSGALVEIGVPGASKVLSTPLLNSFLSRSTPASLLSASKAGPNTAFKKKKYRIVTGALEGEDAVRDASSITPDCMGFSRGGGLVRTFSAAGIEAAAADRRRELRMRELNRDLDRGNAKLKDLRLEPVELLEFPCRYSVGSTVITLFGEGIVTNFRKTDGIYEVLVGWETEAEDETPAPPPPPPPSAPDSRSREAKPLAPSAPEAMLTQDAEEEEEDAEAEEPQRESVASNDRSSLCGGRFCIKMYIPGVAIHC